MPRRAAPASSSSSSSEEEGIEALARSVVEQEQIANANANAASRRRAGAAGGPAAEAREGAGRVTAVMRKAQAMLDDVLDKRIRVVDAGAGGRERAPEGEAEREAGDLLIFRKAKRARGAAPPRALNDPRGFWEFPAAAAGAGAPREGGKGERRAVPTRGREAGARNGAGRGPDSSDIEVRRSYARENFARAAGGRVRPRPGRRARGAGRSTHRRLAIASIRLPPDDSGWRPASPSMPRTSSARPRR